MTATALQFDDLIGVPFVHRGRDPRTGLDCLGVILEMYRRAGIALPDYLRGVEYPERLDRCGVDFFTRNWPELFEEVSTADQLLDLVRIEPSRGVPTHLLVVVEPGELLHASLNTGVILTPLRRFRSGRWKVFRYVGS